jgi:hypothetical protein
MTEQRGSGSMKKRTPVKKLESVTVSKKFLEELILPFKNIGKIEKIECGETEDKLTILYQKGGVNSTS